jgi:hypothetical protein
MRYPRFLPASLLVLFVSFTVGCGSPSHDPNATQGIFKVSSSSPPFIATLLPNSAPVNSVPFTMEVNGDNFDTAAVVFWNGAPLFTRFVNSQQLLADLTSTNLMLAGTVHVYVRAAGLNSNTVEFDLH